MSVQLSDSKVGEKNKFYNMKLNGFRQINLRWSS